jgi:hypothetical protein
VHDAIRFCAEARRLRPDIVFGADLIAGFPTESEAMFANSLSLVEDCGLTFLHVFPFSPRKGTPAARMPQWRVRSVKDRAAQLRRSRRGSLAAHLDDQVGAQVELLIERERLGRTPGFAEIELDGSSSRALWRPPASLGPGKAIARGTASDQVCGVTDKPAKIPWSVQRVPPQRGDDARRCPVRPRPLRRRNRTHPPSRHPNRVGFSASKPASPRRRPSCRKTSPASSPSGSSTLNPSRSWRTCSSRPTWVWKPPRALPAALAKGRFDKEIGTEEVRAVLAAEVERALAPVAKPLRIEGDHKPHVILGYGVNGTGKTTTIGKLAHRLAAEGRTVP